jgi:hypothetical protein
LAEYTILPGVLHIHFGTKFQGARKYNFSLIWLGIYQRAYKKGWQIHWLSTITLTWKMQSRKVCLPQ